MRNRLITLALMGWAATAQSQSFPELGARALAMGGAQVANPSGPLASYWNPAALRLEQPSGAYLYGELQSDGDDLGDTLDELASLRLRQADITTRPDDAAEGAAILEKLSRGDAAVTAFRPSGVFGGGNGYGFSISRLSSAVARPVPDTVRVLPSGDPDTGIGANRSTLNLVTLDSTDYLFSYGIDLGDPRVLVGGSVRYSQGDSRRSITDLLTLPDFTPHDLFDLDDNGFEVSSSAWSFDVSSLLVLHPKFHAGVIGKYLGSPEFDLQDGGKVTIDPRWRAGIAVFPVQNLALAADLDLTDSPFLDGGPEAKFFSFGGELTLAKGRVALRGGLRDAVSGPGAFMLSGGAGIAAGGFLANFAIGQENGRAGTSLSFELGYRKKPAGRAR